MSPQFRSLLSKEWSERRRLFWTGTAILLYYLGYCVAYEFEYRTRAFVASVFASQLFYVFFGSILHSMATACGEYSQRTLKFSSSLPIPLSHIAWARLIASLISLVGPLLIVFVASGFVLASGVIVQAEPRLPTAFAQVQREYLPARDTISAGAAVLFVWKATMIACCLAIYLTTIICLIGTWCRRETTVGFWGVIVVLTSLITTTVGFQFERSGQWFLSDWIGALMPESLGINWSYGEMDGSQYTDLEIAQFLSGPLLINVLLSIGLASWFVSRYGRRSESIRTVTDHRFSRLRAIRFCPQLPFFWKGKVGSLVWLNARQALPLCLAGLIVAGLMTVAELMEMSNRNGVQSSFFRELPHMTWAIGLIWGAIVAVGVFSSETKPETEEFWRSKPISPRSWFWLKFGVGLCVLLITFDLIPALGLVFLQSPRTTSTGTVGLGLIASIYCTPILHAQAYAFTVAAICQLRRTIAAAVLGLVLFYGSDQFLASLPVYPKLSTTNVMNKLMFAEFQHKPFSLFDSGYLQVYGIVVGMILVATFVARKSIARDYILRIGIIVVVGLGSSTQIYAAEPASPVLLEIAEGIEKLESSLLRLHFKLATEELERRPANGTSSRPGSNPPEIDRVVYDHYQDGLKRAWKSFMPDGAFRSNGVFDGKRQSTVYRTGVASVQSRKAEGNFGFSDPVELLLKSRNVTQYRSVAELLRNHPIDAIQEYQVDGERFIDLNLQMQSTPTKDERESQVNSATVIQEVTIRVNSSRQYWPVKITVLVRLQGQTKPISRSETTASGWVESKSVLFPKLVEKVVYLPVDVPESPAKQTAEFQVSSSKKAEVLEFEANPEFADDQFTTPFKPGVGYYDLDDHDYHELDESGRIVPYIPKPKGLRGAVFCYFLASILVGLAYLFHPQTRTAVT